MSRLRRGLGSRDHHATGVELLQSCLTFRFGACPLIDCEECLRKACQPHVALSCAGAEMTSTGSNQSLSAFVALVGPFICCSARSCFQPIHVRPFLHCHPIVAYVETSRLMSRRQGPTECMEGLPLSLYCAAQLPCKPEQPCRDVICLLLLEHACPLLAARGGSLGANGAGHCARQGEDLQCPDGHPA